MARSLARCVTVQVPVNLLSTETESSKSRYCREVCTSIESAACRRMVGQPAPQAGAGDGFGGAAAFAT